MTRKRAEDSPGTATGRSVDEPKNRAYTRSEAADYLDVEERWLGNMTDRGVFVCRDGDVGRGRARQYTRYELLVMAIVTRLPLGMQLSTKLLRAIADMVRQFLLQNLSGAFDEDAEPLLLALFFDRDKALTAEFFTLSNAEGKRAAQVLTKITDAAIVINATEAWSCLPR